MKITKTIHTNVRIEHGPLEKYAPEVRPDPRVPAEELPTALAFLHPEGSIDVYILDDAGRKLIVEKLTGVMPARIIPAGG